MKCKIFGFNSMVDSEEKVNSFLQENKDIVVKHILQSECSDSGDFYSLTITIFYEE